MLIDSLNLNHLRIFECVFRTRSMTSAAQELHLTQSGVSQHIRAFEEVLGVQLFDRLQQKIVPTASAHTLIERCRNGLQEIEQAVAEIKGVGDHLSGTVTIGMPIEFGNNVLMPLIAQFCRNHPLVRVKLTLGFASNLNAKLLSGEMDFAFVDDFGVDRRIATQEVYDEILQLCVAPGLLAEKGGQTKGSRLQNRKYFEQLSYVDYQQDAPVLRKWFEHHLGTPSLHLDLRASVMDVQGLARLVLSGLGAGVLPDHFVRQIQGDAAGPKRRKPILHVFSGCGKPLKNTICVASLRERTQLPAASAMLSSLVESLQKNPEAVAD